ncbi:MAG: hypothetical protein DRR08_05405 [Candidatus Parabeggiatoa sp. nov. 2]|nr:MAG: hypothetical protein B6247_18855 [Beggiatoa sp. 4572_84]RKZ62725.1 MAG: hypothetical protein DRR08_05405 [Gammaproteobacteria bacterium]
MDSQSFQDLLNDIVLRSSGIDGILILDPIEALPLYHNTEYNEARQHGEEIVENHDAIADSLSGVHKIADTLKEFGDNSKRGELQYGIFQLSNGILVLYFLEIHQKPVVVAFISGTPDGLGLMLNHSKAKIGEIEQALNQFLAA